MLVRIIFFINNAYIWIEKGILCYIAEVIFKYVWPFSGHQGLKGYGRALTFQRKIVLFASMKAPDSWWKIISISP